MLSTETKAAVRRTWKLARADSATLTKVFYERLFSVAPAARELFPQDLREQRRKLAVSLDAVVNNLDNLSTVIIELTRLGERHAAYGAKPAHYAVVGEALIWALKQQLGDEWSEEAERAWVETYAVASSIMIEAQQTVSA